tara:strand:+ start:400 stop:1818 length:1419 start_codon:yes stop_codon:yes gene_type:complete
MTETQTEQNQNTAGYKIATALGAVNLGWAIFQWVELVSARQGDKPACAFNDSFDCATVWDGAFATGIHSATSIPVAGWGTIWGLMALAIPFLVMQNNRENLKAATRLVALAGLGSIPVLAGVSFSMGVFCLWCMITYVLVGAYALTLHLKTDGGLFKDLGQGLPASLGFLVMGVVLAIYPASKTPKNQSKAGLAALKDATRNLEQPKPTAPKADPAGTGPSQPPMQKQPITKAEKDLQLASFLKQMPPEALQLISNFLAEYQKAETRPTKPVRAAQGSETAPVLITDFTDAQCGHCAEFVSAMDDLKFAAPLNAFRLEARHFPIDGSCNPAIPSKRDALSCYAAKAQICLEGHPKGHEFTKLIFQNQRQLSVDVINMLGKTLAPDVNLSSCVSQKSTNDKLTADIEYALEHEIEGTPMILVNGRKASAFPPFLFSIMMAEGDGNHPAFAALPKAQERPQNPPPGRGHQGTQH